MSSIIYSGWQCPICGRALSPFTMFCPFCYRNADKEGRKEEEEEKQEKEQTRELTAEIIDQWLNGKEGESSFE